MAKSQLANVGMQIFSDLTWSNLMLTLRVPLCAHICAAVPMKFTVSQGQQDYCSWQAGGHEFINGIHSRWVVRNVILAMCEWVICCIVYLILFSGWLCSTVYWNVILFIIKLSVWLDLRKKWLSFNDTDGNPNEWNYIHHCTNLF